MKTAQPIRDNWYKVDVSLWKYDRTSASSYPEQVITAVARPRDTRITINILAASPVDVADIIWSLYAADQEIVQWALNGVRRVGTKADYQRTYGIDGELDI